MSRVEREREMARRRKRRQKLKKLRTRYRQTNDSSRKSQIAAKARRISAFVDLEKEEA